MPLEYEPAVAIDCTWSNTGVFASMEAILRTETLLTGAVEFFLVEAL